MADFETALHENRGRKNVRREMRVLVLAEVVEAGCVLYASRSQGDSDCV